MKLEPRRTVAGASFLRYSPLMLTIRYRGPPMRIRKQKSTFEQTDKSRSVVWYPFRNSETGTSSDRCDRNAASCEERAAKAIDPVLRDGLERAARSWHELARLLRRLGR